MQRFCDHADDVFVNVNLNTVRDLPTDRETVLHYFEKMKTGLPELQNLDSRETGELVLEGDKSTGQYGWVAVENRRLCSGFVNPTTLDDAHQQHIAVLESAPRLMGLSLADCEALDVMFGFDFTYAGNHDELVANALGLGPSLGSLLEVPNSRVIHFEPNVTLGLNANLTLQCRLSFETRSNAVQVRKGEFPDEQFSVYFAVREHWGQGNDSPFLDSFHRLKTLGEEIVNDKILPRIVRPLARAIEAKR